MYDYLLALGGLNALWREGLAIADHRTEPFHLRPKAHACQHLAEEKIEVYGSPSSFWCYRDEDFIGVVKGIASKTKHPFTLEERIVQKLCIWAAVADC
jgi:predicted nicotinamide N-methyase